MKVQQLPDSSENMAEDILLSVYYSLDEIIERLKTIYDSSERRMIFIDVQSRTFAVPLYLGSFMLHEGDQSLADLTMQALAKILQSYQTLSVTEAELEFKITLLSVENSAFLKEKKEKGRLPTNIFPRQEDKDLAG